MATRFFRQEKTRREDGYRRVEREGYADALRIMTARHRVNKWPRVHSLLPLRKS
jgi:hypothetical protein